MERLVIILMIFVGSTAALLIGQPENAESRFVGIWKLVSLESRSTDGEVTKPFGDHPLRRITYDSNGNMSAFAFRPDRPHFASGDLSQWNSRGNSRGF